MPHIRKPFIAARRSLSLAHLTPGLHSLAVVKAHHQLPQVGRGTWGKIFQHAALLPETPATPTAILNGAWSMVPVRLAVPSLSREGLRLHVRRVLPAPVARL